MGILVIQPGAIGDFVLTLPALRWLREGPGRCGMEIWAERSVLPLVDDPAYAASTRALADTGFDSYPLPDRTVERLRTFNQVFSWRGAANEELVTKVTASHPRAHFLSQFPPAAERVHLADFRRAQLGADFDARPRSFTEADDAFARKYLGDITPPLIALHAGASSERKQWGAKRFAEVASLLAGTGATLLLTEGPLDSDVVDAVNGQLGCRRVRLDNLRQLAAVLARCDLFIGNDSGISHLAAAVGTPVIAIFTATDPAVWAPRGRLVRVLERPSVEDVRAAASEMLAQQAVHAR